MSDRFAPLRKATEAAVFEGGGETSPELRRAAGKGEVPPDLAPLMEKIRSRAYTITDTDLDVLRAHYSDDQLFELIVAATFGAASERLAVALRALEEA